MGHRPVVLLHMLDYFERTQTKTTMPPIITFGQSAAKTVANEFGLEIGEDGDLVDEEGNPVTPSGSDEPMTLEEFAGTGVGSRIFIKDDFNSVSEYVEEHRSDS